MCGQHFKLIVYFKKWLIANYELIDFYSQKTLCVVANHDTYNFYEVLAINFVLIAIAIATCITIATSCISTT